MENTLKILVTLLSVCERYQCLVSAEGSCNGNPAAPPVPGDMTAVYELVDKLRQNIARLEQRQRQLEERVSKANTAIGFSAFMDNGYFFPVAEQTIPFTGVVSNFGNHFNRTTSTFVCPIRGVYRFQFNLYTGVLSSKTKLRTSGELMLDGYKVAEAYCYNENDDSVEVTCGNGVLIECNEGSRVWVQSEYSDCSVFGSPDKETTFSGFLINEL